jgi:hypothetical protein
MQWQLLPDKRKTRKNSGKVDVKYQPRYASALEQCQQMSPFNVPTPATNEDNDTRVGLFGRQRQEIVSIAGNQPQNVFAGVEMLRGGTSFESLFSLLRAPTGLGTQKSRCTLQTTPLES